ncbi:hypothetical protein Sros_9206 [Streptosporangium roseum DSM 43021]|uniref:Uncharacterized protein n=1 Tax=Streptosporangium roseum (strain ATCC 12428 / DSM 43021 / JCM 3005 / KCTC 9067 / NCIMB 10171 / NRRL 2505 / NI 9100) TaxID=479432 RepID=D2BCK5_STRRD|nr:hypothetical protein Sros_9206 [Streptosporangium roseum DSM 43021]
MSYEGVQEAWAILHPLEPCADRTAELGKGQAAGSLGTLCRLTGLTVSR